MSRSEEQLIIYFYHIKNPKQEMNISGLIMWQNKKNYNCYFKWHKKCLTEQTKAEETSLL